ncbi:MAG: ATP-dependent DNA helicase, partial [Panacagrimonas sp.]
MRYGVSVRELCAFTAKAGDLDLRFTPAPTALEGMLGHAKLQARRGPGYESERVLCETFEILQIRGRADGYWPDRQELEEIKTHRGSVERIPQNHRALHWAQLKLYGAMLCAEQNLAEVRLSLVYFDVVKEKETRYSEVHSAISLRLCFEDHARRFLDWALQRSAHRLRRNAALKALRFPFADMHAGQRELAEAAYRRARDGGVLMAQAPTGIGKTLGSLFPTLKACALGQIDRVFFLTAKTSGRKLALDATEQLQTSTSARPLRVLELVAREKACEHPDKACHGGSCPLAKGFFDRLPSARAAAMQHARLDQSAVRELALAHEICPYYLSQELARWSDVVIGDVNYFFDLSALLHALTLANGWKASLLVDEAHNLLDRARGMYSAELDQNRLARVRKLAPKALKRPLEGLNRVWNQVHQDQETDYQVYEQIPPRLLEALGKLTSAITDYLSDEPDGMPPELQTFYFDCLHWRGLADDFAAHSLFDISLMHGARTRSQLCIRNVVPAPFLSERLKLAHSSALFSATLTPPRFYREMLGLPDEAIELDVASPFHADQLSVRVVSRISTRFADRLASLEPMVELIAQQYAAQPGNYLVFLSSFDYLQAVVSCFRARERDVPIWTQTRGMPEAARQQFLDQFLLDGRGIGFAVLGGAFAEGIDLPGSRLIGAFVATLGLPQVNPVNEEFRKRLDLLFGERQGYDYTYLFPGLLKVVQATGRVIRTTDDRGIVYLIDDRYDRRAIRA